MPGAADGRSGGGPRKPGATPASEGARYLGVFVSSGSPPGDRLPCELLNYISQVSATRRGVVPDRQRFASTGAWVHSTCVFSVLFF